MNVEQTVYSETSAYKIQTPANYQEESIQHSKHGESLKSRIFFVIFCVSGSELIQGVPAANWHIGENVPYFKLHRCKQT